MLVSTRYKFVFLSNRKCASSSLVRSLSPFCDIVMEHDHRLRHTSYSEFQRHILPFLVEKIGPEAEEYDVYCLFREPVDWLYSWYRFRTRKGISPEVVPDHWEYTGNMSWGSFLGEALKPKAAQFAKFGGRQHMFVEGVNGSTKGLTLFRYDDFADFLNHMAEKIGEELEVVNFNVSPELAEGPCEEDYQRCRIALAADYRIYDAIPDGGGLVDLDDNTDPADKTTSKASSNVGGILSKIKRKLTP